MAHRIVETLIGRLATDPAFRRRFAENPGAVLAELHGRGELTAIEVEALASLDAAAIETFSAALDRRLRK